MERIDASVPEGRDTDGQHTELTLSCFSRLDCTLSLKWKFEFNWDVSNQPTPLSMWVSLLVLQVFQLATAASILPKSNFQVSVADIACESKP